MQNYNPPETDLGVKVECVLVEDPPDEPVGGYLPPPLSEGE